MGAVRACFSPDYIGATAHVTLSRMAEAFASASHLVCEARVPRIEDAQFKQHAAAAKVGRPVSQALAGTEITLEAKLVA
jgi:osmotically inducible protein OsmC